MSIGGSRRVLADLQTLPYFRVERVGVTPPVMGTL